MGDANVKLVETLRTSRSELVKMRAVVLWRILNSDKPQKKQNEELYLCAKEAGDRKWMDLFMLAIENDEESMED